MLPLTWEAACKDPPLVHPSSRRGVWRTQGSCYRFIADHIDEGSRTLETGLGLSTVLFAMVRTIHTAVFLDPAEGNALRTWAKTHEVNLDTVELLDGGSDVLLPGLPNDPLDLFFIDGGHTYPLPQIDWFYGASRLRKGGVLVLDDIHIWGPHQLVTFLEADPRWERNGGTRKWGAYQRLSEGPLSEDLSEQDFLPRPSTLGIRRRIRKALRSRKPPGG